MDIVNNVSWINDKELDLLKATASLSFSLGGFRSLDDIFTKLKVVVIIEPGIVETQDSPILKKCLEYWERKAERLKKRLNDDVYSDERYQEAMRNIEELNYELRISSKHFLRGLYDAKENVVKLYPDEMRQEYDGHHIEDLLVSTLAHETMHTYFGRKGFGRYPFVYHVEEPLAEFGNLLFLHETGCGCYQWAYNDVKSKKNCYRYGAMLMDQHLKAGPASLERRYLERYPIRLNPHAMLSVKNGTVSMPLGGVLCAPVKIDGHSFWPHWENMFETPPRYYYDEPTGTLCLDGYWGKTHIKEGGNIRIDGRSEMYSQEINRIYLGANFDTDDILRRVYPISLCPVYVSPMNGVFAEVNNIPVYKSNGKPALRSCGKGLYAICRNGKWGVIDESFNQVIQCKYDGLGAFYRNGLMRVSVLQKDGSFLYGRVNLQGVEQIPVIYESIHINPRGTYTVRKNGEEYTIDSLGNRIEKDNK